MPRVPDDPVLLEALERGESARLVHRLGGLLDLGVGLVGHLRPKRPLQPARLDAVVVGDRREIDQGHVASVLEKLPRRLQAVAEHRVGVDVAEVDVHRRRAVVDHDRRGAPAELVLPVGNDHLEAFGVAGNGHLERSQPGVPLLERRRRDGRERLLGHRGEQVALGRRPGRVVAVVDASGADFDRLAGPDHRRSGHVEPVRRRGADRRLHGPLGRHEGVAAVAFDVDGGSHRVAVVAPPVLREPLHGRAPVDDADAPVARLRPLGQPDDDPPGHVPVVREPDRAGAARPDGGDEAGARAVELGLRPRAGDAKGHDGAGREVLRFGSVGEREIVGAADDQCVVGVEVGASGREPVLPFAAWERSKALPENRLVWVFPLALQRIEEEGLLAVFALLPGHARRAVIRRGLALCPGLRRHGEQGRPRARRFEEMTPIGIAWVHGPFTFPSLPRRAVGSR